MVLELQPEDVVFADAIRLLRQRHVVAQQRKTGQRAVVLVALVEEQAQLSEDDPQLLPAVAVLEFAQKVAANLALQCERK